MMARHWLCILRSRRRCPPRADEIIQWLRGIWLVLGEAEDALADDVALNLAGAARDGVLPGADDAVVPAGVVGHGGAGLVDQHARAQELAREVGDAGAQLGAEELEDGALGSRRLPAQLARDVAQPRVAETRGLDPELGEALAHERVFPRGAAVHAELAGQGAQGGDRLRVAAAA